MTWLTIDYEVAPFAGSRYWSIARCASYQTSGRVMRDGLHLTPVELARLGGHRIDDPAFESAVRAVQARLELGPEPARWAAAVVYHALRRLRGTSCQRGPDSVVFDEGPARVQTAVVREDRDAVLAALRGIEVGDYAPARFYLSWDPLCARGEVAERGELLRWDVLP